MTDVNVKSMGCHSAKVISTTVDNSIVSMICGVISLTIREGHGIQCMPCSPQIISETLFEIHTTEELNSQAIKSLSNN